MKLFELDPRTKMQDLIREIDRASDAYYNDREIMSDHEFDELIDELKQLEESTGIVLPNSPTQKVGAPVKVDKLKKVKHEFPALSLDKTKDIEQIMKTFDVNHDLSDEVVVMWKLDGSTVQLTYENGQLVLAATRGDGHIGQDITHNAKYITGIPLVVEDKSKFTVRGEALISYEDFEEINAKLPEDEKFKNPRNLAAASITMLNPEDMKDRHVQFYAFELVDHEDMKNKSFFWRLVFCSNQGFQVVPHNIFSVHEGSVIDTLRFELESSNPKMVNYTLPVDGLVIAYDNTTLTDSLKGTAHHPHILKGYAFKWEDETAETVLRSIEWSPSRTGLLNPVAIFDPVELEGTTVSRASLHNLSIMRMLHINIGDSIEVCKANKIIPQIVCNLNEESSESYKLIHSQSFEFNNQVVKCPTCESVAEVFESNDGIYTLYCRNPECSAKLIYKFEHFCERTSMNIEGLSEATIEKFVSLGYLKQFSDIYTLNHHENEIKNLDGFGLQSWNNLWEAIQNSRNTTFTRFVTAAGIPNIGTSQAKALDTYFNSDIDRFLSSKYLDFSVIDGIGHIVSQHILTWLHDARLQQEVQAVLPFLNFEISTQLKGNIFEGKTFVVTGKVYRYKNRKELESEIESNGGKVSSSVSSNTSYLINNDINSTSSKNKKAKELNIPIITEEEYIQMLS